jgi:hypothetical protein
MFKQVLLLEGRKQFPRQLWGKRQTELNKLDMGSGTPDAKYLPWAKINMTI